MTYPEVYSRLNFETAIITFFKKDGQLRVMLGTRNLSTVSILHGFQGQVLGGHDTRCNIKNGNLAVYDLVIGDARSFNIDRLVDVDWLGTIGTKEEMDIALERFKKYKDNYESSRESSIGFNDVK